LHRGNSRENASPDAGTSARNNKLIVAEQKEILKEMYIEENSLIQADTPYKLLRVVYRNGAGKV